MNKEIKEIREKNVEETCGMEERGRKFPHLTNSVNGDPNEGRALPSF